MKILHQKMKWKLWSCYQKICFKRRTNKIVKLLSIDDIYLIGTPEHGNLGDHAIAIAEQKFLANYFPYRKVIEITGDHFRADAERIAKQVSKRVTVLITGGGFLGNLWMLEEIMVRKVIELFPGNKIVIFPQTIFFEDNETKESEFQITKCIYQNHKDLHIFVRESASYEFIKDKLYGGNFADCRLVPDIATYLNVSESKIIRDVILLCLREDKERTLSGIDLERIEKIAIASNYSITYTSTVLKRNISLTKRNVELDAKLNEFRRSKLVITDRLHGMIFAAITETPCIAINNSSGKVKGVYQWLKHLDYIRFIDSINELPVWIEVMLKKTDCHYDNEHLKKLFSEIGSVIDQQFPTAISGKSEVV